MFHARDNCGEFGVQAAASGAFMAQPLLRGSEEICESSQGWGSTPPIITQEATCHDPERGKGVTVGGSVSRLGHATEHKRVVDGVVTPIGGERRISEIPPKGDNVNQPAVICLEKALPNGAVGRPIKFCARDDIIGIAGEDFSLDALSFDVEGCKDMRRSARNLIEHVPKRLKREPMKALQLFTGGSYEEHFGVPTWAVVVFGLDSENSWRWCRYISGTVPQHLLTTDCVSVLPGEMLAVYSAVWTAVQAGVQAVAIHSDSQNTIDFMNGRATPEHATPLHSAMFGASLVLRSRGIYLSICHVPGHANHPGNELTDAIAGSVRPPRGKQNPPFEDANFTHIQEGSIDWLWLVACGRRTKHGPAFDREVWSRQICSE